jgi:L-lactate utilization protein LutC
LGSVHALTSSGEFVIASNTGSQLPHVAFTSPNLIFIVSTKKIVSTLDQALNRLTKYVIDLEDQRMMNAYKSHTADNKILIFKGENPMTNRSIVFILVAQDLGF